MEPSTIVFLVSHFAFAITVLMVLLTIRGILDYRISKDPKLLNYIGLSLCTAMLSIGDVVVTSYQAMPFNLWIYNWLWATSFYSSYFYLTVIGDFLEIRSKVFGILLKLLAISGALTVFSLLQAIITGDSFLFSPQARVVDNYMVHAAGGDLVTPKTPLLFFGGIGIFLMLSIIISFLYITVRYRRSEKLLIFGLVLSMVVTFNDTLVGFALVSTPSLMFFGKFFEILRMGEYYHRQSLSRVRALESQLDEVSKQAATALVAGGLAHDVNNALAILDGDVRILKKIGQEELSEKLARHVKKLKDTVRAYLYLIKGSREINAEKVGVKKIIETAIEFAQTRLQLNGVSDLRNTVENDIIMYTQPVHVEMILANLLINAADALADAESKWIRLEAQKLQSPAGDIVEIRVINPGKIPPQVASKLFESGFSTKGAKGSGVGLKISSQLAKANLGSLVFEQRDNEVCFCLSLPAVQRKPTTEFSRSDVTYQIA